ncbi:MAG: ABC transporter permease [Oscillospiraceae bacterium]|nr:ABC transporter permease [Oscillospiraceae bacterium]
MLGKLLKYEFKSTARTFLPLYALVIVFSFIFKLSIELEKNLNVSIFSMFLSIIYAILIIGVIAITFVVILQQFFKTLLGDEGYLMFTLPVEPHLHIFTKLITAFSWIIGSTIVSILSVIILAFSKTIFADIANVLKEIPTDMLVQILIIIIFAGISSILMIYASMSIGQLITGHKIIGSVAAYLGIYFAYQILYSIILVIIIAISPNFFYNLAFDGITLLIFTSVMSGIQIINSIVYFIITNYIFKNKLNLE